MKFLAVDCETLWPIISLIKNGIIPLIQVGIPIILIVLGMLDLGKAVVASKEDEIKATRINNLELITTPFRVGKNSISGYARDIFNNTNFTSCNFVEKCAFTNIWLSNYCY